MRLTIRRPDYNTLMEVARKRKASSYLNKKVQEGLKEKRYINQLIPNEE